MNKRSAEWWRGFMLGGAVSWIVAAGMLALFARATAAIPFGEPDHSQFTREADAIGLKIFVIAAAPGFLALLIIATRERFRRR